MRTEPRFVTPADYYNYYGTNLDEALRADSNDSNKANLFLMQAEDLLLSWADMVNSWHTPWEEAKRFPHAYECLQKAILAQAQYMLINGNLFMDSGYDPQKGFLTNADQLKDAAICESAKTYLKESGLFSMVLRTLPKYPMW